MAAQRPHMILIGPKVSLVIFGGHKGPPNYIWTVYSPHATNCLLCFSSHKSCNLIYVQKCNATTLLLYNLGVDSRRQRIWLAFVVWSVWVAVDGILGKTALLRYAASRQLPNYLVSCAPWPVCPPPGLLWLVMTSHIGHHWFPFTNDMSEGGVFTWAYAVTPPRKKERMEAFLFQYLFIFTTRFICVVWR